MAKINEQKITIKLSKLIRDNDDTLDIISEEMLEALLTAIQEMAGENVLIELE